MSAPSSPVSSAPSSGLARPALYGVVAAVAVVALLVLGLTYANYIPGVHLGGSGSPASTPPGTPVSPSTYSVTFSETGLVSGATWSVSLNGSTRSSATSSLAFDELAGSYLFTVTPVAGYDVTPQLGTVTVTDSSTSVPLAFAKKAVTSVYAVEFQEAGLAAATSWSVTVNGTVLSGTTATLNVSEPNGSYSYTVGALAHYAATPSGGSVTVAAHPVTVRIAFVPAVAPGGAGEYAVAFYQSGLPGTATWSVAGSEAVGDFACTAEGLQQSFDLPNGTYSWFAFTSYTNSSLPAGTVYYASPNSANVTVAGSNQSILLTFRPAEPSNSSTKYPVNFTESGLPSTARWTVVAGSANGSAAAGAPIYLNLTNGTYYYSAGTNASGYSALGYYGVVVDGGPASSTVVFGPTTVVRFNVTGGLGYNPWSLTLTQNGSVVQSESGSIGSDVNFTLPNGIYGWRASALQYSLTPSSGEFEANGTHFTIVIYASLATSHGVTIQIAGLGVDPAWSVNLWPWNSSQFGGLGYFVSGTSSLTFHVPDGTYAWSVAALNSAAIADPTSGVVTVAGGPRSAWANFTTVPANATVVEFSDISQFSYNAPAFPAGTTWNVTFHGVTQTSSGEFIDFAAANGTYDYKVGSVSGFAVFPSGGTLTVSADPNGSQVVLGADVWVNYARTTGAPVPTSATVHPPEPGARGLRRA